MRTITITIMDEAILLRLSAWFSPAFPTGGYAYSGGLEATDCEVSEWCEASLEHGSLRNDVVLCAMTLRGEDVADLARALASCAARLGETEEQGAAFLRAAADWDAAAADIPPLPLPVAVGRACAALPHRAVLTAFAQSGLANAVAAAQRLGRIGQRDGVRLLARLEPAVLRVASEAAAGTLTLATATFNAEIAAMRHETLPSRIHRS